MWVPNGKRLNGAGALKRSLQGRQNVNNNKKKEKKRDIEAAVNMYMKYAKIKSHSTQRQRKN